MWLDQVKKEYGDNLQINWRHFSLQQINSRQDADWKVWSELGLREASSLLSSVAAEAAKRQGNSEAFDRFHLALLTARHAGDRTPLNQDEPLIKLAEEAGLDVERFKNDLDDPALIQAVAEDHEEASLESRNVRHPHVPVRERTLGLYEDLHPARGRGCRGFRQFRVPIRRQDVCRRGQVPAAPVAKGGLRLACVDVHRHSCESGNLRRGGVWLIS